MLTLLISPYMICALVYRRFSRTSITFAIACVLLIPLTNSFPAQSFSSIPSPKEQAELKKLELENRKIEQELSERWLNRLTSSAQVAGGVVLVITFIFSVLGWFSQRKAEREKREEERFLSLVREAGAAYPSLRASAAAGLASYLQPHPSASSRSSAYSPFRPRTIQILADALGLEPDPIVRKAIGQYLVAAGEDAVKPLLELMTRIRQIVNPKWNLIGKYFREATTNNELAEAKFQTAEHARKVRGEIEALQDAFLIAVLAISEIRKVPPNLERAPFREISLIEEQTALQSANFSRASLMGADFFDTNLEGANFTQADLAGAKYADADLKNATFDRAILSKTDFRGAKNLDPQAVLRAARWEDAEFDEDVKKILSKQGKS